MDRKIFESVNRNSFSLLIRADIFTICAFYLGKFDIAGHKPENAGTAPPILWFPASPTGSDFITLYAARIILCSPCNEAWRARASDSAITTAAGKPILPR